MLTRNIDFYEILPFFKSSMAVIKNHQELPKYRNFNQHQNKTFQHSRIISELQIDQLHISRVKPFKKIREHEN